MENDKKTSGKVHVFSGERPQRLTESKEDQMQRRRKSPRNAQAYAEKPQNIQGQFAKSANGQNLKKQDKKTTNKQPLRESRYTGTTWAVSEKNTSTKRRREMEDERKMQSLKLSLGVLIVVLIATIFYEVILGHGTKMTGSERMAEQERQRQEMLMQTEELTTEDSTELE